MPELVELNGMFGDESRLRSVRAEAIGVVGELGVWAPGDLFTLVDCDSPETMDDTFYSVTDEAASPKSQSMNETLTASMAGSPLKTNFLDISKLRSSVPKTEGRRCATGEEEKDDVHINPFPAHVARSLLSGYIVKAREDPKLRQNVLIAADGQDFSANIFFGVSWTKAQLRTFRIDLKCLEKKALPSLDSLKSRISMGRAVGGGAIHTKSSAWVLAADPDHADSASLQLAALWGAPVQLLAAPAHDAKITATMKAGWGDSRTGCPSEFVPDIDHLKVLCAGLKTGQFAWKSGPVIAKQAIKDLIKLNTAYLKEESAERHQGDFCLELWDILKGCRSYAEVGSCWAEVMAGLGGGWLKPVVVPANKTRFGRLATEAKEGRLQSPLLDGMLPALLLVEVGLFAVGERLSASLRGLLGDSAQVPRGDGTDVEEQLGAVERLQTIAAVLFTAKSFLGLDDHLLATLAKKCGAELKTGASARDVVVEFHLRASDISDLVKRWKSGSWSVCLDGEGALGTGVGVWASNPTSFAAPTQPEAKAAPNFTSQLFLSRVPLKGAH